MSLILLPMLRFITLPFPTLQHTQLSHVLSAFRTGLMTRSQKFPATTKNC